MDIKLLEKHFSRIGARIKVNLGGSTGLSHYTLDLRGDQQGEVFVLNVVENAKEPIEFYILDAQPKERHLLLMARYSTRFSEVTKHKLLCGHDERHWFVAAVPENRSVRTVRDAMDALKPQEVLDAQRASGIKAKNWNKRRNETFVRQGEWFFVPYPGFEPESELQTLRNEPIQRSGGTPHIVEELYRCGSETVYVSSYYPSGLTEEEYTDLLERDRNAKWYNWAVMQRVTEVYAKGKVRHPDHKTITLPFWHRVLMSTENESAAGVAVAFLD